MAEDVPDAPAAEELVCRVCHGPGSREEPLCRPCQCRGSVAHVHQECLVAWLRTTGRTHCELCGHTFRFAVEWEQGTPDVLPMWEFIHGTWGLLKEMVHVSTRPAHPLDDMPVDPAVVPAVEEVERVDGEERDAGDEVEDDGEGQDAIDGVENDVAEAPVEEVRERLNPNDLFGRGDGVDEDEEVVGPPGRQEWMLLAAQAIPLACVAAILPVYMGILYESLVEDTMQGSLQVFADRASRALRLILPNVLFRVVGFGSDVKGMSLEEGARLSWTGAVVLATFLVIFFLVLPLFSADLRAIRLIATLEAHVVHLEERRNTIVKTVHAWVQRRARWVAWLQRERSREEQGEVDGGVWEEESTTQNLPPPGPFTPVGSELRRRRVGRTPASAGSERRVQFNLAESEEQPRMSLPGTPLSAASYASIASRHRSFNSPIATAVVAASMRGVPPSLLLHPSPAPSPTISHMPTVPRAVRVQDDVAVLEEAAFDKRESLWEWWRARGRRERERGRGRREEGGGGGERRIGLGMAFWVALSCTAYAIASVAVFTIAIGSSHGFLGSAGSALLLTPSWGLDPISFPGPTVIGAPGHSPLIHLKNDTDIVKKEDGSALVELEWDENTGRWTAQRERFTARRLSAALIELAFGIGTELSRYFGAESDQEQARWRPSPFGWFVERQSPLPDALRAALGDASGAGSDHALLFPPTERWTALLDPKKVQFLRWNSTACIDVAESLRVTARKPKPRKFALTIEVTRDGDFPLHGINRTEEVSSTSIHPISLLPKTSWWTTQYLRHNLADLATRDVALATIRDIKVHGAPLLISALFGVSPILRKCSVSKLPASNFTKPLQYIPPSISSTIPPAPHSPMRGVVSAFAPPATVDEEGSGTRVWTPPGLELEEDGAVPGTGKRRNALRNSRLHALELWKQTAARTAMIVAQEMRRAMRLVGLWLFGVRRSLAVASAWTSDAVVRALISRTRMEKSSFRMTFSRAAVVLGDAVTAGHVFQLRTDLERYGWESLLPPRWFLGPKPTPRAAATVAWNARLENEKAKRSSRSVFKRVASDAQDPELHFNASQVIDPFEPVCASEPKRDAPESLVDIRDFVSLIFFGTFSTPPLTKPNSPHPIPPEEWAPLGPNHCEGVAVNHSSTQPRCSYRKNLALTRELAPVTVAPWEADVVRLVLGGVGWTLISLGVVIVFALAQIILAIDVYCTRESRLGCAECARVICMPRWGRAVRLHPLPGKGAQFVTLPTREEDLFPEEPPTTLGRRAKGAVKFISTVSVALCLTSLFFFVRYLTSASRTEIATKSAKATVFFFAWGVVVFALSRVSAYVPAMFRLFRSVSEQVSTSLGQTTPPAALDELCPPEDGVDLEEAPRLGFVWTWRDIAPPWTPLFLLGALGRCAVAFFLILIRIFLVEIPLIIALDTVTGVVFAPLFPAVFARDLRVLADEPVVTLLVSILRATWLHALASNVLEAFEEETGRSLWDLAFPCCPCAFPLCQRWCARRHLEEAERERRELELDLEAAEEDEDNFDDDIIDGMIADQIGDENEWDMDGDEEDEEGDDVEAELEREMERLGDAIRNLAAAVRGREEGEGDGEGEGEGEGEGGGEGEGEGGEGREEHVENQMRRDEEVLEELEEEISNRGDVDVAVLVMEQPFGGLDLARERGAVGGRRGRRRVRRFAGPNGGLVNGVDNAQLRRQIQRRRRALRGGFVFHACFNLGFVGALDTIAIAIVRGLSALMVVVLGALVPWMLLDGLALAIQARLFGRTGLGMLLRQALQDIRTFVVSGLGGGVQEVDFSATSLRLVTEWALPILLNVSLLASVWIPEGRLQLRNILSNWVRRFVRTYQGMRENRPLQGARVIDAPAVPPPLAGEGQNGREQVVQGGGEGGGDDDRQGPQPPDPGLSLAVLLAITLPGAIASGLIVIAGSLVGRQTYESPDGGESHGFVLSAQAEQHLVGAGREWTAATLLVALGMIGSVIVTSFLPPRHEQRPQRHPPQPRQQLLQRGEGEDGGGDNPVVPAQEDSTAMHREVLEYAWSLVMRVGVGFLDAAAAVTFFVIWFVLNPLLVGIAMELSAGRLKAPLATNYLTNATNRLVVGAPVYFSLIRFAVSVGNMLRAQGVGGEGGGGNNNGGGLFFFAGPRRVDENQDDDAIPFRSIQDHLTTLVRNIAILADRGFQGFRPWWALEHTVLPVLVAVAWILGPPVVLARFVLPMTNAAPEVIAAFNAVGTTLWILFLIIAFSIAYCISFFQSLHNQVKERIYGRQQRLLNVDE